MPKNNNRHREHNHVIETEKWKLRNVAYTQTHDLIRCEDGFFGWLIKEES